jgi:hypothetical protein
MARWRTASGLGGGHAQAVASEGFAQRRPRGAQLGGGGIDTAQPLGRGEGAFGFGAVRKEAAGLPAHPPLQLWQAPLGEGALQGVAVDAELAGGLPQPDSAGQLVGLWLRSQESTSAATNR